MRNKAVELIVSALAGSAVILLGAYLCGCRQSGPPLTERERAEATLLARAKAGELVEAVGGVVLIAQPAEDGVITVRQTVGSTEHSIRIEALARLAGYVTTNTHHDLRYGELAAHFLTQRPPTR